MSYNPTTGGSPTGAASGDLGGTYPSPTVTKATSLTSFNGVPTAGWGVPAIVAFSGRLIGQTAGIASLATYTVGASDGSFEISAGVICTAGSPNLNVQVAWTDETSSARTAVVVNITTQTNVAKSGVFRIRAKAATTIVVSTTGTTGTYNVDADIRQVA